jgi:predicted phosphate transport protein (TIGR00153 family)
VLAAEIGRNPREGPMLGWFKALMPKETRFFDLFVQHATIVVAGAEALRKVLNGGAEVERYCRMISQRESEADEITREAMVALRRTFITPFDRADIRDLVTSLDDSIDQMNKTAKTIMLFEVRSFEQEMQLMGDIILQASKLILEAMPLLGSIPRNANRLAAITDEVIRFEEQADLVHDRGRKTLVIASKAAQNKLIDYIMGTELYDHMESVVDRLEDVANEINALVVDQL